MNNELLKQLAPPHAPPPPGWWPLAPGWWLLALLLVLIVAGLIYWYLRPSRRLRRIALRELAQLEIHVQDDFQLARELQDLLRRYAIAAYGRATVANLSGDSWLAFLVAHGGKELAGEAGQSLLRAAYGGSMLHERGLWLHGAQNFLRGRQ
jgi:cbb3-type cytochrome oxidase subunit 3